MKIGINDIQNFLNFENYFGLIRSYSYWGFIFNWLLWAVVRDHKSNILSHLLVFNLSGLLFPGPQGQNFKVILASNSRANKGQVGILANQIFFTDKLQEYNQAGNNYCVYDFWEDNPLINTYFTANSGVNIVDGVTYQDGSYITKTGAAGPCPEFLIQS